MVFREEYHPLANGFILRPRRNQAPSHRPKLVSGLRCARLPGLLATGRCYSGARPAEYLPRCSTESSDCGYWNVAPKRPHIVSLVMSIGLVASVSQASKNGSARTFKVPAIASGDALEDPYPVQKPVHPLPYRLASRKAISHRGAMPAFRHRSSLPPTDEQPPLLLLRSRTFF